MPALPRTLTMMTMTTVPTFIGALGHPPPAHGHALRRGALPGGTVPPRPRVLHLRLDEELQDVRVLLVTVAVARRRGPRGQSVMIGRRVGGGGGAEDQVTVVEPALHGIVHDVEPGPGVLRAARALVALVGLLQVLGQTGHAAVRIL